MRRKIQKLMKYVVLGSILAGLVAAQFVFLYAFEKREKETITVFYEDPITSNPVSYEKKYTLHTPISYSGDLPVIIMLHGDIVDEKSLNLEKSEFIKKGYMVVLVSLDFTYQSYLELEAVLNQLLIHPDVDNSKIGILGHSHGGHFAFWFARLYNHVIQCVIMANMGTISQLYVDYYEYYNYFVNTTRDISFLEYSANFTEKLTADNPNNLLIITDYFQPARTSDTSEENIYAWEFEHENVLIGSFENGTARELNTEYKMFFHGSGLYNPLAIKKNIEWMNNALGLPIDEIPSLPITLRVYGYFSLIAAICVFASILLYKGLNSIPFQLSWIKNRLYSRRKKKTQNVALEIPKVLDIDPDGKPKKDIFRLERRYAEDFDFIHDTAEYFRIIVITVIGFHLFLYLLELLFGENSLYYVEQTNVDSIFSGVFAFNDTLNSILFTNPLSFQVMYFWILMVFFFRRLRIKDPRIQKPKINILDIPNIILLAVEVFVMFWIFGYICVYQWLGLNFLQSGLNVVLRFSILFYIHFIVVEFAYNQASSPDSIDRRVYILTILFILLMYLPLTVPSISILIHAYKYAPYYIAPYLAVTGLVIGFSIFGKKNAFQITIPIFFILLFWKYNMFYWVLF